MSEVNSVEQLEWYHPTVTRHMAESMLMQNGIDGTYLLRPSSKDGEFALSVKCDKSVKHFMIAWTGEGFKFGHGVFRSVDNLLEHFGNKPLIGGESGQLVLLSHPYPRNIAEPNTYESVTVHAEFSTATHKDSPDFSINSKEGFLTKLGQHFKTWKTRWFVLQRTELKYFKEKTDKRPIRSLDLKECTECVTDSVSHPTKTHVFKLVFPWRTFFIYASSEQEREEWLRVINWRLNATKNRKESRS